MQVTCITQLLIVMNLSYGNPHGGMKVRETTFQVSFAERK